MRRIVRSGYRIQKDKDWIKKSGFNISLLEEKNVFRVLIQKITKRFDNSKSEKSVRSQVLVDTSADIDMPNFNLLVVNA